MHSLLKRCMTLTAGVCLGAISTITMAQSYANTEIVPTGKLRVGINGANATLYARAADGGGAGRFHARCDSD